MENYLNSDNWPETQYHPAVGEQVPLPTAGCLPRIVAWVIDSLLVGLGLLALSFLFPLYLFQLGPSGRGLGFAVIIAYFAYSSSHLGNGQTVGKRLTKIQVTDRQGHPLSIRRALIRSLVLYLIYLLNGWQHPVFIESRFLQLIGGFIVFGGVVTIVYGFIFNRATRQGSHDFLAGSVVTSAKRDPHLDYRAAEGADSHKEVMVILLIVVGLLSVLLLSIGRSPDTDDLQDLRQAISEDDRFVATGISQPTSRHLTVTVWYLDRLPDDRGLALSYDVADIVAREYADGGRIKTIRVVIFEAIDLGFANRMQSYSWNFEYSGQ